MTKRIRKTGIAGWAALTVVVALALCAAADEGPDAIAAAAFETRLSGRVDEAVRMLEEGLDDYPEAGVLHHELARARLYLLDIAGMQEEAEAAVRCAPDDNGCRYFAAMASVYSLIDAAHHGDQDRMKELGRGALDQLETILQNDPDLHRARYLLVQQSVDMAPELGLETGNVEAHVRLLEEKDPILGAKARCCIVDEKEQKKIWGEILDEHPEDCRVLVEAAEGLIEAGDLVLAASCLDKAIEKDKELCYGLLRLGLAHAMRGDWDRAVALTERYVRLEPPVALKAFAIARLGMIHKRQGNRERADALLDEAKELDPHVWLTFGAPPQEIFTPL